ncbi:hypothetical protein DFO61_3377 [Ectopseudomonas oleovorans]|uniref:Uncharacterized protein n=1 Tax=Ectopseudomonas oleovorans TaxID=301 RepID=A0A397MIV1_ECTOL|nr:hypothetical protein DFO61_3377 [Pseudomonas oleovorans]
MGKFPASSHLPHVRPGMTDLSAHTPIVLVYSINFATKPVLIGLAAI